MNRSPYGSLPDGTPVDRFVLTSGRGVEVSVMPYGAAIVSVCAPDRNGRMDDVVLGFDTLEEYLLKARYFGTVVGRFANRIAKGRFTLDDVTYQLAVNNGAHHLHGGVRGFDKIVWNVERVEDRAITFTLTSPDGDEGYPGTLTASVTYTLTPANALVLNYRAVTDRATPINLTNHVYFNLSGRHGRDILAHELTIGADRYTPTGEGQIPTGEIAPVAGTPFDFRKPVAIGARIDGDLNQLRGGNGYDHNFVLNGSGLRRAAHVVDPVSGRTLDVDTTEPGVQFYAGNNLDLARNGFARRTGVCLETQHFPDSPNQPQFPSTILRPGQIFESTTVFTFGVTP